MESRFNKKKRLNTLVVMRRVDLLLSDAKYIIIG